MNILYNVDQFNLFVYQYSLISAYYSNDFVIVFSQPKKNQCLEHYSKTEINILIEINSSSSSSLIMSTTH